MKVILDKEAIMPTRAHETDAGMDLYTRYDEIVPARGYAIFDTGVHIEIPKECNANIIRIKSFQDRFMEARING